MAKQRTVCITGGAGFIGSHLSGAFAAQGDRVIVIDDLSSGRRENVPASAELHVLDIRGREAAELVETSGIDLLVHQAAQMDVRRSVRDPVFDADVNVLGTLNLLEAARKGGVGRVLFASTGGAIYGEQDRFPADEDHPERPVSPYGVSKLAIERYLFYYHTEYGLDAVCLRYANVYGERQNPHGEAGVVAIFHDRLLDGKTPVINGDGMQTRDYVHVSDVVRANLAVADFSGLGTFNVGTGRETTVVELCEKIYGALGAEGQPSFGPGKPGEQRRSCVDPGRLRGAYGLPEPRSLESGLQLTARWFREAHLRRAESGVDEERS